MGIAQLQFPLVNGVFHDFSSVETSCGGLPSSFNTGWHSITFKDERKPAKVYGTGHAQKLGRGRGQYDADGKVQMYIANDQALISALGALPNNKGLGVYEYTFDMTVSFRDGPPGFPILTWLLKDVNFLTGELDTVNVNGTDVAVMSRNLDVMYIIPPAKFAPISGLLP